VRYAIGIDFGGTNLKGGVVSEDGKVRVRHKGLKTRGQRPGTEIAADLAKLAADLAKQCPKAEAIGVGTPGIVLPNGKYGFPPCNCPNFGKIDLRKVIEDHVGKPTFMNNDAQVFSTGEMKWGAGQGAKCMLMLTLGTGIGGGLCVHGQDFQGARNTIEIGHMSVNFSPEAPLCGCGQRGCAEAYASDTGIARQAQDAIDRGLLPRVKRGPDAEWVYKMAKAGHPAAAGIISTAHEALATLIANYGNTMSVDVCLLAGGITAAGDYLLDDVRSRVKSRMIPTAKVDIRPSALGSNFSVLGAAAYAFSRLDA